MVSKNRIGIICVPNKPTEGAGRSVASRFTKWGKSANLIFFCKSSCTLSFSGYQYYIGTVPKRHHFIPDAILYYFFAANTTHFHSYLPIPASSRHFICL